MTVSIDHEDDSADGGFEHCFLNQARLERRNKAEGLERDQCIELLKAILTVDAAQRITPSEVLSHPFM